MQIIHDCSFASAHNLPQVGVYTPETHIQAGVPVTFYPVIVPPCGQSIQSVGGAWWLQLGYDNPSTGTNIFLPPFTGSPPPLTHTFGNEYINQAVQLSLQLKYLNDENYIEGLGGPSILLRVVGCQYHLAITPSMQEIAPDQTGFEGAVAIKAQLTSSGNTGASGCSLQGKTIQFTATATQSNGHNHDAADRPIGEFDQSVCTTDDTGACTVNYLASEISGIETITATLSDNTSITASTDLAVRVPNLVPLSGGPYTFKCLVFPNADACDPEIYGHENTYNVTPSVNDSMFVIASVYRAAFPGSAPLVVNDASLAWGGLYDIRSNWLSPHKYHRTGTDIDVRSLTTVSPYGIPEAHRKKFEQAVCRFGSGFPRLEHPGNQQNEHYHLYFHAYTDSVKRLCPEETGDSQ